VFQKRFHFILTLLICAACQSTSDNSRPIPSPTNTPIPVLAVFPTREPRTIPTQETPLPAPSSTLVPTATDNPFVLPASPLPTLDIAMMTRVAYVPSQAITIGYSVEGRAIIARRFGEGSRVLLLVGGMHGGWEANTVALMNELIAYFESHPEDILPGMSLVLIPAANPDGLLRGRTAEGRFNANGVDLNRNWSCGWSSVAVWRNQRVNPGVTAFSEPETLALAEYIRGLRPAAAFFYHSAANGVYAGDCDSEIIPSDSQALSAVLGEATGYDNGQPFTAYPVTGTAATWVDGQGIPSADVELQTWTDTEFERNLRGILAVQRWVLTQ
jgi:hypothetical protein